MTDAPPRTGTTRPLSLGYRPALDGLRGVFLPFIVAYHAHWQVNNGAEVGLFMFFTLSGFLITVLLLQERDRTGLIDLRGFFVRRALRLGPALIAMLVVSTLFAISLPHDPESRLSLKSAPFVLFELANWRLALGTGNVLGWFEHTWSLSVEEQFYLIWGVLLFFLVKRPWTPQRRALVLGVLASTLAIASYVERVLLLHGGTNPTRVIYGTDTIADHVLWGCALGCLWSGVLSRSDRARDLARRICNVLIFPAGVILALHMFALQEVADRIGLHQTISTFFAVTALANVVLVAHVVLSARSPITRVSGSRFFALIGRTCYGTYIWHFPILLLLVAHFPTHHKIVLWPVELVLIVAASAFSWRYIEQPFLARKRTIALARSGDPT